MAARTCARWRCCPASPAHTGATAAARLLATAASFDLNYNAVRKPSGPAATRTINHLKLGEALLRRRIRRSARCSSPPTIPAVTNPDTAKVRAGLAREDLFTVVHDPFMTATARYADIVLPATTYLETEDFYRSYGTYYMQYGQRAVAPVGEAWSNLRLTQALAARMGLTDAVFSMSPPEILQELFRGGGIDADPASLLDGTPVSIGTQSRPTLPHPVGQAGVRFENAGGPGLAAAAGLAAGAGGEVRLSAPPADRAGILPKPHGIFRRRVPARAGGRAVRCAASRRRSVPRPERRSGGSALQ